MDHSVWSHLPPEIIDHVLSRLPIKSLCRLKCVSSSWNSLISSPQFAQTHVHITNTTNKSQKTIFISTYNDALYSVDFAHPNPTAKKLDFLDFPSDKNNGIEVSGSCNGLVLINDKNSNILFNPFTGECKKLPNSPISGIMTRLLESRYLVRGLGYDSSTDNYKVVLLLVHKSFDPDVRIVNVVVYSLKTNAWSRIKVSHYDYPLAICHGFYFNERLHWPCVDGPTTLAAFDLSDEIFREVLLPASFDDRVNRWIEFSQMAVLGGSLCLVVWPYPETGIEVWMMKKYGVRESWTKQFTIDNPRMNIGDVLCMSAEDKVVLIAYGKMVDVNGEIVVDEYPGGKLILYNPKEETMRVMVVSGIPTKLNGGGNYMETLVSPNHGGQIRRHRGASLSESSKSYKKFRYKYISGGCVSGQTAPSRKNLKLVSLIKDPSLCNLSL